MPRPLVIIRRLIFAAFTLLYLWLLFGLTYRQAQSEIMLIAALAAALALALRFVPTLFRILNKAFAWIAQRRAMAVLFVGLAVFAASAVLSWRLGMRDPDVTDEFSYLLAADTFARGRIANPPHPMWVHFETIHVIHQPTYASKYQPGQGLILALGQIIAHPIIGVWLNMALAAATICWMLMAWVPPRWALVGGLLTLFHPMFIQWSQSYWGGALPMIGGALVIGAFRRIIESARPRDSLMFGLGLAVLANSRPFEGFVLSFLLGAILLAWMLKRNGPSWRASLRRIVLPLAASLALIAVLNGYYNYRVTGSPLRLPYMVHEEHYGIAPLFIFQKPKPEPIYRHESLRIIHSSWELDSYLSQQSWEGRLEGAKYKLTGLVDWNLNNLVFLIPLLALPFALRRDRWMRLALLICALLAIALLLETWMLPHYPAPLVGLLLIAVVVSMRHLNALRFGRWAIGRAIVRATLVIAAVLLIKSWANEPPAPRGDWYSERARIIERLDQSRERHLIIVRYGPQHRLHEEWVWNEADIDGAKVVWAREMDAENNRKLLEYFKGRRVWLLQSDDGPATLGEYPLDKSPPADSGL